MNLLYGHIHPFAEERPELGHLCVCAWTSELTAHLDVEKQQRLWVLRTMRRVEYFRRSFKEYSRPKSFCWGNWATDFQYLYIVHEIMNYTKSVAHNFWIPIPPQLRRFLCFVRSSFATKAADPGEIYAADWLTRRTHSHHLLISSVAQNLCGVLAKNSQNLLSLVFFMKRLSKTNSVARVSVIVVVV